MSRELADVGIARDPSRTPARLSALPLVAWLAVALLLALFLYGLTTQRLQAGLVPRPDMVAPDFQLTTFDGQTVHLASYRGKVVVVNFWASWCAPCRDEQPLLQTLWERYRDRGVVFLGIDVQDNDHDARAFIKEFQTTYPMAPDPGGRVSINYGVVGFPETYVISRSGTIARKFTGPVDAMQMIGTLEDLLR
ncbi:MAG TPA: TlpA disulfide reductase family protein [Chloroflexota bacterium]|nr:TlpA disulfide reductase family protein [Chloroflexota bacterium]